MFKRAKPKQSEKEFVALIALMMSLAALSIDAILPALPQIALAFGLPPGNHIQQVIVVLFLGLTLGQLIYGPISDLLGRKRTIAAGVLIFVIGTLTAILTKEFTAFLVGRFLQGFGVAAMRIVPLAIVRDQYTGAAMARILSLITAVFILVPCVAPILGQCILMIAPWRAIFWFLFLMSLVAMTWFWLRLPETLDTRARPRFGISPILKGIHTTLFNKKTVAYTLAIGLIQGAYVGYLLSAEQIFHDIFQTGDLFALYFALSAMAIGVASFVNSQLVEGLGMERIDRFALIGIIAISSLASIVEVTGSLRLSGFLVALSAISFCIGMMVGNMNAIALLPLGHIAGLANSTIGFISGAVSLYPVALP